MDKSKHEFDRAKERLEAARLLLKNEKYEDSVSRAYYSMFHAVKVLLRTEGISPKTHRGLVGEFGRKFVKTGAVPKRYSAMLSNAETLRESADYGLSPEIGPKDAKTVVEDAEDFLKMSKEFIAEK